MQKLIHCIFHNRQLGWCAHYSDLLQAGQFRDQILLGERFYMPSRPALGSTQYPVQWVLALSQGNAAKHSTSHSPPSLRLRMGRSYTSASPLCLHRHVMGWPLLLCFIIAKWIWQRNVIFIDNVCAVLQEFYLKYMI